MNTTPRDQSQTLAYTRDVIVARRTSPEPNRHQRRHLVRLAQVNPVSFLRGYALAQCISTSPTAPSPQAAGLPTAAT